MVLMYVSMTRMKLLHVSIDPLELISQSPERYTFASPNARWSASSSCLHGASSFCYHLPVKRVGEWQLRWLHRQPRGNL